MNDLKIEAKVIEIQDVKTGTNSAGKEWSSQVFVVETDERYPKKTAFQVNGKLLDDVKRLKVGQKVTVFFDAISREYNGSWYTQANAWKIEGVGAANVEATVAQNVATATTQTPAQAPEDDLPF